MIRLKPEFVTVIPPELTNRNYTRYSNDIADFISESMKTSVRVLLKDYWYHVEFPSTRMEMIFKLRYSEYVDD